jgi:subtilisin family serine protease
VVPPHLDIAQARVALQQVAPDSTLSFNQQYRLYPHAKGESSQISLEPARATGGCTPDRCYGAQMIGWQGDLGVCARDLKIGIIDTGIDGSHPALSHDPGRINYGVIGPEKRVPGNDLHGTGVLALLAGDPKSSTPGLVPRAKFFVADIFFADEKGLPVSTTMHLIEALDWMERMQVQIINLSLSGPSDDLVKAAIAKMSRTRAVDGTTRPGTIFIAAAGNGGPGAPPSYPAAYSEVVAVTAVSKDLRSYRRANQGDYIDIAAPGVDIWTALPNGRQGFQTGTSFATPYVTAVVASVYRTLPRVRTKTAVLQRLPVQDLGIPGPDRVYGRGLLNAPASCDPSKMPVANRRVPVVPTTKVSAN